MYFSFKWSRTQAITSEPIPRGGGAYLTREVKGCVANLSISYTLSHKKFPKSLHTMHPVVILSKFCRNSIKILSKSIVFISTLSHNFLINCNTSLDDFYQKKTPCRLIFTVKGLPFERHIPLSQVWEYSSPPPMGACHSAVVLL